MVAVGLLDAWPLLKTWLAIEMLFLFYTAWRHHVMSSKLSQPQPYPMGHKRLFARILDFLVVHQVDFEEFISGWFLGAPFDQIRHGNVEEFFTWAFFATSPDKINAQEELEVKGMISEMCGALHIEFPPGFTPDVPCMRLNLDEVHYSHRPLLYYLGIVALNQSVALLLRLVGFERGCIEGISYWWKEPSSSLPQSISPKDVGQCNMQEPLLFFHGIGIGIAPYLQLLNKMCARQYFSNGSRQREWCRRGVLLIEVPSIAQGMAEYTPTAPHMVRVVQEFAKRKRIPRFGTVVGHSFGSVPVAWLIQKIPHMVGSTVLIDPVCFLLFLPDVAYNFLYRRPQTIVTQAINLLASRELYTANALFRHFWWYCNVLWYDEITCPALVVLSGKDDIVNAEKVYDYLMVESKRKKSSSPNSSLIRSVSSNSSSNSSSSSCKERGRLAVAMQTETRHQPHTSGTGTSITATATATVFGEATAEDAAAVAACATASAAVAVSQAAAASASASASYVSGMGGEADGKKRHGGKQCKPTRMTQLNVSSGKHPATSTIWFHDMNHAQILFRPDLQDKVVDQMSKMEDTMYL